MPPLQLRTCRRHPNLHNLTPQSTSSSLRPHLRRGRSSSAPKLPSSSSSSSLQRSSFSAFETRSCTARRPRCHLRLGVPLHERTETHVRAFPTIDRFLALLSNPLQGSARRFLLRLSLCRWLFVITRHGHFSFRAHLGIECEIKIAGGANSVGSPRGEGHLVVVDWLEERDASAYVTTGVTGSAACCLQWENAKIQRMGLRSGSGIRSPLGVGRLCRCVLTGLTRRAAPRLSSGHVSSQRMGLRRKGVDVSLRPSRRVGRIGVCDDWVDVPFALRLQLENAANARSEHTSRPKGVEVCLVPSEERDTSVCVTIGSRCCAAPRLNWDSGGSLQWPGHVEQPAPRERTQIPVAT